MMIRNIPNFITVVRILLVVPIVYFLVARAFNEALVLFVIAGLSDALDGYLARKNNWHSTLGSILDPVADKLLMITTFLSLLYLQVIPPWLFMSILLRDVVIVGGASAYYFFIGRYDMAPSVISKVNTMMQLAFVATVLLSLTPVSVPAILVDVLSYLLLTTVVLSGADYIVSWSKRALHANGKVKIHD